MPKAGRQGFSTKVALITIVDQEFEITQELFGLKQKLGVPGYFAKAEAPDHHYDVVLLRASDRGNHGAEEAIIDFVQDFYPSYFVIIGIAGGAIGRDDVELGDVVIADFIEYYEMLKIESGKLISRKTPHDHPSLYMRAKIAEPLRWVHEWRAHIKAPRPEAGVPKAIVGHIAAGEKLFDDPEHQYQREILTMCDKSLAVDMESYGIGRGAFRARRSVEYNAQFLVLRGLSDSVVAKNAEPEAKLKNLDEKAANAEVRKRWRKYAANSAAAFAVEVVNDLLK